MSRLVLLIALVCSACAGAAEQSRPGGTGIRGQVVASPTCPVETGDPACEPAPVEARIVVVSLEGAARNVFPSDPDGTFSIGLRPGQYQVHAEPVDQLMRVAPRPLRVTVTEGAVSEITVVVDTGLRTPTPAS